MTKRLESGEIEEIIEEIEVESEELNPDSDLTFESMFEYPGEYNYDE